MASSSSLASSRLISTFSFKSWDHDVFLSFRGEDTRKTFVDHLYTALKQQGIHTYKDDETLPRGESIGPSLLQAIRESRIAVIIFSKNYADSCWCLDELAYIMECKDKRGQIVMPVFYDVDPSDVRKQTGKYGEVFANKHELENSHKVDSWRKALANAGNLSGWVPKDIANGHEAKCIEEIVRTISSRLSRLFSNDDRDDLIGMEIRLEDLESKLEIGSGGVRFVGLWGVGGSGKTTLASFACKKFSPDFEAHCILENIREESNKHGLKTLQEKLLSLILKTDHVKLDSEEKGRCEIKRRLGHKNVLIVLDDVDDLKQLEELAGSHDWFGKGSRIIITTRDEHVLTREADEIYGVSLLSEDEAIKLFNRHAYREAKPVEDYETLSQAVVSYAGGLPLALKVLGSSLYDKDKNEWMSFLAKLRDIPNPKIMDKLKISYDALQSDEKELFLDIACVLRRWPLDKAKMVLEACNFYTVIGVKVLVQKSLINVTNGIFEMHDLIEEMAHYIVIGERPKHPERLSRVWRVEDVLDICSIDTKMENDETEVLVLPPRLPDDIENLNRLWMFGYTAPLPSHVTNPCLPPVVANMKKLRWIYWEGYPKSSLPTNFQPINLGCLTLIMGRQKELWQGYKHLPNLKILDLRYSKYLKRTPDFKGLPLLERLYLKACENLKEIHSSIGYHERLVFIDMEGCSKVKIFPPIVRMKKLETLKLSECDGLKKFPVIQTNMDSLKELCLDGTGIEIVPSSVGQFCTNLASLDLHGCPKLKIIEGNFRLLKHLRYLNLQGCSQLDKLEENFFDVEECCLDELSLSTKSQVSTSSKKYFMNRIGLHISHKQMSIKFPKFPRFLRELNLSGCYIGDGDIPSDMCQLVNLQVLNLSLNKFSRLDSSLSGIPHLKSLDLSDCYNLVELPDLPLSICILKATDCDSLEKVGDLSKYKCLWKVSLWREHKLINGGEMVVLHSMLQGNVNEDRFMSVTLPGGPQVTNKFPYRRIFTLQLPQNWINDFSGFLVCGDNLQNDPYIIVITERSMSMNSQPDHWEEFDKNQESYDYALAGYLPFCSLQDTPWWNSTNTEISFDIAGIANPKVALVPRKTKGDLKVRAKGEKEFSGEEAEGRKTFSIIGDSKVFGMIIWSHGFIGNGFIPTKMQVIDGVVEPSIIVQEPDEVGEEAERIAYAYAKMWKKKAREDMRRSI